MPEARVSKSISEEGCAKFTAQAVGSAADNPSHALALNELQKNHLVTAQYDNVSSFTIVFAATNGNGGRNFIFSGVAPLCGKMFFSFLAFIFFSFLDKITNFILPNVYFYKTQQFIPLDQHMHLPLNLPLKKDPTYEPTKNPTHKPTKEPTREPTHEPTRNSPWNDP